MIPMQRRYPIAFRENDAEHGDGTQVERRGAQVRQNGSAQDAGRGQFAGAFRMVSA